MNYSDILKNKVFRKIAFICSAVLLVIALVMLVFSLVILFTPGTVFEQSALILPGVCLVLAVIGFIGIRKLRG